MVIAANNTEKLLDHYNQKKSVLINEISTLSENDKNDVGLYKNTSNLFRYRTGPSKRIDVRNFNQVIHVDEVNQIAEIEGMTTYEDIVKETLKFNLMPTVVPELKSITIGGALAGCGIESSSFRYGLTHENMFEYELLLSDGKIITCRSDNEHKELFYAFPNTYGTLGYALKIKVKLIPVKKYIKLTHKHFKNADDYFKRLNEICTENRSQGSIAFIDGVVFDKNDMYLTLGEFVDDAPYTSNYKYMNIYYKSIKKLSEDYLTTVDYIWRWDPDWFWCSRHFLMENYFARMILGKFLLKSTNYWKIRQFFNRNPFAKPISNWMTGQVESIIQDVEIPVQQASQFLEFFQKEIGIKPIWICPTKPYQADHLFSFYKMDPNLLYINFGFWDMKPTSKEDNYYNRKIEQCVRTLGGNKSLYSQIFYSEDEFWNIFDKTLYMRLKDQYDPKRKLKDLYQKCKGK